ncbi:MAG: type II toxin-antitoxin system RelE/ParE family toxin [Planctomycetes bacterium]|nr:type II toxin-antitoxin system RelE/ParE family toxin [Planctomycetota bacterium]
MSFHVVLQPRAEYDLDAILTHLKKESLQGAASWFRAWRHAVSLLERQADIYGSAPEDADHEPFIQQTLFKTRSGRYYRAIYTLIDQTVYVLHVRGHGQDLVEPDELTLPHG